MYYREDSSASGVVARVGYDIDGQNEEKICALAGLRGAEALPDTAQLHTWR